jgi:hypothetical protein
MIRGNVVLFSSTAYRTVPQLLSPVPYRTVPYRTILLIFFQHRPVPYRYGTLRYGISIAHRQSLLGFLKNRQYTMITFIYMIYLRKQALVSLGFHTYPY